MKILGVIFQNSLKWNSHILHVTKSASSRMLLLRRLKKIPMITKADLVDVYNACIRSLLEYNSPIFIGLSGENAKSLERIERRCHQIICHRHCKCDVLGDISKRRKDLSLRTLNKIMHPSNMLHHLAPKALPRTKHLSIPFCKTNRRANSFFPFVSSLYNFSLFNCGN